MHKCAHQKLQGDWAFQVKTPECLILAKLASASPLKILTNYCWPLQSSYSFCVHFPCNTIFACCPWDICLSDYSLKGLKISSFKACWTQLPNCPVYSSLWVRQIWWWRLLKNSDLSEVVLVSQQSDNRAQSAWRKGDGPVSCTLPENA